MTRFIMPFTVLATMFALALPTQAQNGALTRSFVSSAGTDGNPCTITAPCATFAYAYTVIGANGIIAALDPGKYGPITITGPVTINGNGWAAITAPAQGNGITITASASDKVALIGLEIDGAGAGYNGIVLNSAGSLTVTDCTLQNFVGAGTHGNGILMQPTSGTLDFTITNTTASNNFTDGILYLPPSGSPNANGTIDNVVAIANDDGINIDTNATTGGTTVVTVSNSIASNNRNVGFYFQNGSATATVKASVDDVSASGDLTGVRADGTPKVMLGRSVIVGNANGVIDGTSSSTLYTLKDNRVSLNGAANTLSTTLATE